MSNTAIVLESETDPHSIAYKKPRKYRALREEFDFNDPAVRAQFDPNLKAPEPVIVEDVNALPTDPPATNAEEETYKKRYGDLRRHTQRLQDEANAEKAALREQLSQATKQELKMPKSEEELEAWAKEYPDVAAIIETIALKKFKEQSSSMETELASVQEMKLAVAREKGENKIRAKHPDCDELRDDPEFHKWASEQGKWVREALYEDEDPDSVISAIDFYKAQKKVNTPEPPKKPDNTARLAAEAITRTQNKVAPNPSLTDKEGVYYESQVRKMHAKEYARHEEAIDDARRAGKFVYDLTGGAR